MCQYKTKNKIILINEIKNSKLLDMKLIVGLGNYGKEYEHTRHNMGFDVVDKFAESLGEDIDKSGFHSLYKKLKYFDEDIILVKPQTYMNNSGIAVKEIKDYFKIELEDIIIIYDDMDIQIGHLKLKNNGSSAGHNGIKSIIQHLGTQEFKRIRVGIGSPNYNVIDFVLTKPNKEDQELIDESQKNAVEALKISIKESFNKAMTLYNK